MRKATLFHHHFKFLKWKLKFQKRYKNLIFSRWWRQRTSTRCLGSLPVISTNTLESSFQLPSYVFRWTHINLSNINSINWMHIYSMYIYWIYYFQLMYWIIYQHLSVCFIKISLSLPPSSISHEPCQKCFLFQDTLVEDLVFLQKDT